MGNLLHLCLQAAVVDIIGMEITVRLLVAAERINHLAQDILLNLLLGAIKHLKIIPHQAHILLNLQAAQLLRHRAPSLHHQVILNRKHLPSLLLQQLETLLHPHLNKKQELF